jgi:hypothetical protein
MKESETATVMCGWAREASDRCDDEEAKALFCMALEKAEAVHGPDNMIVALVLRSLVIFHQKINQAEKAVEMRMRLDAILNKYGVAEIELKL